MRWPRALTNLPKALGKIQKISRSRSKKCEALPNAVASNISHERMIAPNFRDAVRDQMSDRSASGSPADVGRDAGDENRLGRSTFIDIVHPRSALPSVDVKTVYWFPWLDNIWSRDRK